MRADGKTSLLGRLHPLARLAYSLLVSLLVVLLAKPAHLLVLACLTSGVLLLAGVPARRFKALLFIVLSIVVSTMVSQAFFYYFEPRTVLLTVIPERFPVIGRLTGGVAIYREGIAYGSVQSLRLVSATFMAAAIAASTHPSECLVWLRKVRLPRELGLVMVVSIRFMPQMVEEMKRILLGLRLRGVKTRGLVNTVRAFRLLLPSLVLNSLRQARMLAIAAEVRGFSAAGPRRTTGLARFIKKFSTVDLVVVAFFISLLYLAALPFRMGLSRGPFHPRVPLLCAVHLRPLHGYTARPEMRGSDPDYMR